MSNENLKIYASVYPTAPNDAQNYKDLKINETYLKNSHDKNLYESRLNEMYSKKLELENTLKHYRKLEKRWIHIHNGLKYSGLGLAGITGVTACILTGSVVLIPSAFVLGITLTGVSAIEVIVTKVLSSSITKKKKKYYYKKCLIIKENISKLYIYTEKARNDAYISEKEIEGFRDLVRNYDRELNIQKHDKTVYVNTDDMTRLMNELKKMKNDTIPPNGIL